MGDGLREVRATRYVLALREGGSLPGLIEADDLGTYVVKFHGAGQGRKALVAEVIAGELARELGLPVTELVTVDLDATMANAEPDEEVQDLLRASPGRNLGMDYLPGSLGIETPAHIDADLAARVVWFDAFVQNVDRSWAQPEHAVLARCTLAYRPRRGAVLPPRLAGPGPGADPALPDRCRAHPADQRRPSAGRARRAGTAGHRPAARRRHRPGADAWLTGEPGFAGLDEVRRAYVDVLLQRLSQPESWLDAVEVARAAAL